VICTLPCSYPDISPLCLFSRTHKDLDNADYRYEAFEEYVEHFDRIVADEGTRLVQPEGIRAGIYLLLFLNLTPKAKVISALIPNQADTYSVDFHIIITHSPGNLQYHRCITVRAWIVGDIQYTYSHCWDTNLGLEHIRVTDMDELPLDPIQDI
jgi:hypothetical protein